jgi:hypothetical protein
MESCHTWTAQHTWNVHLDSTAHTGGTQRCLLLLYTTESRMHQGCSLSRELHLPSTLLPATHTPLLTSSHGPCSCPFLGPNCTPCTAALAPCCCPCHLFTLSTSSPCPCPCPLPATPHMSPASPPSLTPHLSSGGSSLGISLTRRSSLAATGSFTP